MGVPITEEDREKWIKAGKIAAQALEYGRELLKPGANLLEVCNAIDDKIVELGGVPAWPTQAGINEVAAHATPDPDETTILKDEIICLDVGAQVDGCVGDNALTVDLSGNHAALVKATEEALNNAIKIAGIGVTVGELSKVIQETIQKHGFSPVRNLSGHGISKWVIHDKPTIPNVAIDDDTKLEKNMVIAIEPFATDGAGVVYESDRCNIFALIKKKPVRSPIARQVLQFIEKNYKNLPFSSRWLAREFGIGKTNLAIRELFQAGMLKDHPPLVEKNKGMVSVCEKTILIDDEVTILTQA